MTDENMFFDEKPKIKRLIIPDFMAYHKTLDQ